MEKISGETGGGGGGGGGLGGEREGGARKHFVDSNENVSDPLPDT